VALLEAGQPRLVDPEAPLIRADDQGVGRGDGAFETLHLRGDTPWLADEHLERFERSLARLEITPPPREQLERLLKTAADGWRARHRDAVPEAGLKLICTRGPEGGDEATVFALVFAVPAAMMATRESGIRLAALTVGYSASTRATAPWLLGGVKSLSYAVNMACLREAKRRGCDDVLWHTSDEIVLEGPTAGVVWQRGERLATTELDTGILASTTVQFLLDRAEDVGLTAATQRLRLDELGTLEGLWLCSSVRGVVPVTAVLTEGGTIALPTSPLTPQLRGLAGF
jgi:4-amino-4-deoxychorismate lyase